MTRRDLEALGGLVAIALLIAARIAWPFWCASQCEAAKGRVVWMSGGSIACIEGP